MKPKISIYPFLMIGLITGTLLALLLTQGKSGEILGLFFTHFGVASHAELRMLLYYWVGFYGGMFLLSYPTAQSLKRLILVTFIPSFIAALPYYWLSSSTFSQTILLFFSSYALIAFHLHYQENQFYFSYPILFHAVWDTFVKMIVSLFFTLLCWLIVFASGQLFNFISITFINKLIAKDWFEIGLTALLMSIGLYIPSYFEKILQNMRFFFLLICRYLFIPLAVISIIFIVSFLINIKQQHFGSGSQSSFLLISFFSVVFLNGIYEEGGALRSYAPVLIWIARIFVLITPIFAILALYGMYYYDYNSVSKNGWNIHNFSYCFNALILLIYNAAYCVLAFRKRVWGFKPIERVNVILAVMVVVLAMITTYPSITNHFPKASVQTSAVAKS